MGVKARPWQERFMRYVEQRNGHWIWVGREPKAFSIKAGEVISAYEGAGKILGRPKTLDIPSRAICGQVNCIFPDHVIGREEADESRDNEICRRWKKYLENYTNTAILAHQYGISRQRVHQIIRRRFGSGARRWLQLRASAAEVRRGK